MIFSSWGNQLQVASSSGYSQPVFDRQTWNALEVTQIVCYAYRTHGDGLRGDHGVGTPNLLAGLPQVALDRESLAGCTGVKWRNAHYLEPLLKSDAFRARFTRTGYASPDFHSSQRGDCKRSAWGDSDSCADFVVAGFFFERCFNDAGVKQVPHRLK
jgi:hypothetical protein